MPKTRPPYGPEFKAEAVQLFKDSGKPRSVIARDLGVSTESLRHWIKQLEIDRGEREGDICPCAECWESPPVAIMRGSSGEQPQEANRM